MPTTDVPVSYARQGVASKGRARRWWIIAAGIVGLGALTLGMRGAAIGWWDRLLGVEADNGDYHVVEPVTLSITLTEDGELKPRQSAEIKCEVEGQSTILFVVDESSRVKKGELLVELASDALEDRQRTKQMELDRIEAEYEASVADLEIQKNQNAANIKAAEINLKVAELDLKKYLEGDFIGQLKAINVNIEQTAMDIKRKEVDLAEDLELAKKGWVTENEIEDREFALKVAKLQLDRHELSKLILEQFEKPKIEMQRRSAVDKATSELADEKKRAESRENKAEARVRQYSAQLENAREGLAKIEKQIVNCKMYAPTDGVVQYPSDGGYGRGRGGIVVAVGESVRKGQTLIVLPDTSQMIVKTRIHEADRHMIKEGLSCIVTVPAVPGEAFSGSILKIDKFADSENRWLNPDLKEHGAEILLNQTDAPLSPGDSAEVKIMIDTVENTLAVPVQCVFTRGADSYVFTDDSGGGEPVLVQLGRSNTSMIEVIDGLENGQRIYMHTDEQMLAKLPVGTASGKTVMHTPDKPKPGQPGPGKPGSGKPRPGRAAEKAGRPQHPTGGKPQSVPAAAGAGKPAPSQDDS